MINWKVRMKNKIFWLSIIPALLLLVSRLASVFGINLDFSTLGVKLAAVVESVFAVLALLGVVTDPTTEGVNDSEQAMTYEKPKQKGE